MLTVGGQTGPRRCSAAEGCVWPQLLGGAARHHWPAAAGSGRRRLGGGRVWDGRERRRPSLLRLTRCSGFFFGAMCASAGLRMRLWIAATASCRKIKQRTQPSKFFVHHYLPLESLEPIAGKHFSFKMESSGGAGGIRFSCQMSYFNGSECTQGIRFDVWRASAGIRFPKRGSEGASVFVKWASAQPKHKF